MAVFQNSTAGRLSFLQEIFKMCLSLNIGKQVDKMFEIDKAAFGKFITEQRKAKGYTQKELAEKLFVSDKAVSKWERALSMPDISLLVPLAEILDVSVTELLEGRRLDQASEMNAEQVEILVKKALNFPEEKPERNKEQQKKYAIIFGGCTLAAVVEVLAGFWCLSKMGVSLFPVHLLVMELLSFIFGIYFWLFMKERLPSYYDENKINNICDGMFQMNVPGVYFNNSNWVYIVKALRMWSAVTIVAVPLLCMFLAAFVSDFWWMFGFQNIFLVLYLAGMFVPIYIVGKKYGNT